jgi:Fe-S cluster assembly protein SufD
MYTTQSKMINQLETPLYESIIAKFEIAALQSSNSQVGNLRQEAFEIFKTLGFPSIKNEEWKFTNVLPSLKEDFELELNQGELSKDDFNKVAKMVTSHLEAIQNSIKGEQKGAYRLIAINGIFNETLSILPEGGQIKIKSLSAANTEAAFVHHFGKIATVKENPFVALNTALFNDGLFIEITKNVVLDKPLHIINVLLAETNVFVQPRNLFVINQNASLEIIETTVTNEAGHIVFANGVTEIALAENAHLHHYDIQTGHKGLRLIQRTEATQQQHSNYSNYTFSLPGTDLVRNNLVLHLDAKDLESHLYGLYLTAGKQLVDNHTEVHHKFPNGESNQLYKGVLMDESKAVFNGKIFVYQDAQKTNAFQQSNNILFSEKATVNAKPQLEIFADDVKCSHGTTIGQMNKESLFYLQSRGISEQTAKNMMVNAFAFDVTQKVKIAPVRVYLEKLIAAEMERNAQ